MYQPLGIRYKLLAILAKENESDCYNQEINQLSNT